MAKYKAHLYLFLFFLLYVFVKLINAYNLINLSFFQFYFTDLLFVPSMCLFALIGVRIIKQNNEIKIPSKYVFIQTVLVSILFEYVLPITEKYAKQQTSDLKDVAMYFMGAIIYLQLQKRL